MALANGYIMLGHGTYGVRASFAKARSAAEKARILDPQLADSYDVTAGVKLYMEWDWQGAEENFLQAQSLNPSLAWSYYQYAWLLALHDRMDEAIEANTRARDLDPFFATYSAWLGGFTSSPEIGSAPWLRPNAPMKLIRKTPMRFGY